MVLENYPEASSSLWGQLPEFTGCEFPQKEETLRLVSQHYNRSAINQVQRLVCFLGAIHC